MIILDTNVISELMRPSPSPQVTEWLSQQDGQSVFLTTVTEAEIRFGLALLPLGSRRKALEAAMNDMLDQEFRDRILPFDRAAAHLYSVIGAQHRAAGQPISQFDCQIVSIARSHGARLATRNTDDFEGCGVMLVNPWL